MDPQIRIRIRTKISWIRNTGYTTPLSQYLPVLVPRKPWRGTLSTLSKTLVSSYRYYFNTNVFGPGSEMIIKKSDLDPEKFPIQQDLVSQHWFFYRTLIGSVPDPDPNPDPPDPRVFRPPGSGSTSQRYGSGSGSFYHHAKIIRKTLNPIILWLFLTFYLWKMM